MAYLTYETAAEGGAPVELYDWTVGSTHYRYTSGRSSVSYGGQTYAPAYIVRGPVARTAKGGADEVSIRCARTLGLLAALDGRYPGRCSLTIYRYHRTDPATQTIAYWYGRLVAVTYDASEVYLICRGPRGLAQAPMAQRWAGPVCQWELFGPRCLLCRHAVALAGLTVSAVSLPTVTLAGWGGGSYADQYMRGATLTAYWGATSATAVILDQTGLVLTISGYVDATTATADINSATEYLVTDTITNLVGDSKVYAAQFGILPDGYFNGGTLYHTLSGETANITNHTAGYCQLDTGISGMIIGDSIDVYPGCDHRRTTCYTKFNNIRQFGGCPWIPKRTPYDQRSNRTAGR